MAKFYIVKCACGNEQKVFGHASQTVRCGKCQQPVAQSSGGEAAILGEIVKELD